MFKKKVCNMCGKSYRKNYEFCPFCGNTLDKKEEDLGMLGNMDSLNETKFNELKLPRGFNILFNSLLKNLEKQLRNAEGKNREPEELKKGNISISISTFGNNLPAINVNPLGENKKIKKKKSFNKSFSNNFDSNRLKKFLELPRVEPKTNLRRVSDKIIYEIDLPGVRSVKDVSILNLEKSMEIKAFSERKAYQKSVPIALPIVNYKFSKGKLVLELDT